MYILIFDFIRDFHEYSTKSRLLWEHDITAFAGHPKAALQNLNELLNDT